MVDIRHRGLEKQKAPRGGFGSGVVMAQRRRERTDLFGTHRPRDRRLVDVGETGEALLAAVMANPDDDGPRLVYADWLLERGDVRGEFIVLQVQAARLAPGPERSDLEARAQVLLDKHQREWVRPFMGDQRTMEAFGRKYTSASPTKWTFERGFVHTATVSAQSFPDVAAGLFAREPVVRVHLTNRGLDDVLRAPGLERLRELDLANFRLRDGSAALFASRRFTSLRELDLTKAGVGVKGAAAMAKARAGAFPALERLQLAINGLSDAALEHLAKAPILATVRHLDLAQNNFGSRGFVALCSSPFLTRLETLRIGGSPVGLQGASALARFRETMVSLTLHAAQLGDAGFETLVEDPWPKLRHLCVSSNNLSKAALSNFPGWLHSLETLEL